MRGPALAPLGVLLCLPACAGAVATTEAGGGGGSDGGGGSAPAPIVNEATFVDAPARQVTLHGETVSIAARARLFVNLWPADDAPEDKPILVAFNGFATDIVHSFGTSPVTVDEAGAIVPNPHSLTRFANILYVDPRQAGFSYDVVDSVPGALDAAGAPTFEECSRRVFNEYVDAADVLFATMRFLRDRPALRGPVVWFGESYAGARIQWMLAYLRGRWDLAPYADPTLAAEIAAKDDAARFVGDQVLLQPWLLGGAHATAISNACEDPEVIAAVAASVGATCGVNACGCANVHGRSPYNFALTKVEQERRVHDAVKAHLDPAGFEALHGVPLANVAGLAAADRAKGFKCNVADASMAKEGELVAALGPLPEAQFYYLPYNPLQPGKELDLAPADWSSVDLLGAAFVDNARVSRVLVTDGALDLVVPARALAPGLRAIIGDQAVVDEPTGDVTITTADGPRTITIRPYPDTGHMITMFAAGPFADDTRAFVAAAGSGE